MTQYQKALELQPHDAPGHNNLGVALAGGGRFDDAMVQFQRGLEIKPDDVGLHGNLANALASRGRFAEAKAHYDAALKLRPDHVDAQKNLAWLRATCPQESFRNSSEAIELAQRANKLCGGNGRTCWIAWPPPTPQPAGFRKPWPPRAKPWSLPGNKTPARWPMPCGPGSRYTRPASHFSKRRRLRRRQHVDTFGTLITATSPWAEDEIVAEHPTPHHRDGGGGNAAGRFPTSPPARRAIRHGLFAACFC